MERSHPIHKAAVVVLAILFFLACPALAEQRCVLVELITWLQCPACPRADAALDSLSGEYPDDSLAVIRYHVLLGDDPFYQPESYDRALTYYGASGLPTAYFDGWYKTRLGDATSEESLYVCYKESIEVCLAMPSPLNMALSVTYDSLSHGGQAQIQVTAVDSVPSYDLTLRCALIESGLIYEDEPYDQVFRDMVPDLDGIGFAIASEGTFRDTVDFSLDSSWVPENCDLVVFVQDDVTKQVLQTVRQRLPVPPTPAAVDDLSGTLAGAALLLTWSEVTKDKIGRPLDVDYYQVYRDTSRYFVPGAETFLDSTAGTWFLDDGGGAVGDDAVNSYYYVTAVSGGKESEPSGGVGEFDIFLQSAK